MFTKKVFSRLVSFLFVAALLLAQAGPAHAADTGTISGTVKDTTGNPIIGVSVSVRAVFKSDGSEVAVAMSDDSNGTYTLSDLPLDTALAVVASDEDPDSDGYLAQYYNNTIDLEWAEPITLTDTSQSRNNVDFLLSQEWMYIEQFTFNNRADRLLHDVQLRKAIAHGTNRQTLLEEAFEPNGLTGELVHVMVSPAAWYLADSGDLTIYAYNKTEAETILDAAGWSDINAEGFRENGSGEELALDFWTSDAPARLASANLFKDQMAEIGIRITLLPNSWDILSSGDFDIAEFAWSWWATEEFLTSIYYTGNESNFGEFSSIALDGHYDNARDAKVAGNLTGFENHALLWQQTFTDELPALPLFTRGNWPPNPHFSVRANDDNVEGWEWPNGATVTIEIERDGTLEITRTAEVGPHPDDPNNIRFEYNFGGEFDIQPGDVVTVTDGTTTKSTIVSVHSITGIDVDTDIVYGVSDPDVRVYVWACDNNNCDYNRHADTDSITGEWQVDFSQPGIEPHEQNTLDIGPGTWIDSEQRDSDGDSTRFGLNVPNPSFSARLIENEVHGYQWTLGAEVTLSIDDPNTPQPIDYTKTLTVGLADWNPNETFVQFRLWEDEFTLTGGMTLTMSDGETQKTHLVTSLTVTGVDPDADTVRGTAVPGSFVEVGHLCDENGCAIRRIYADGNGDWMADFSEPGAGDDPDEQRLFNIRPGMGNEARQCDEDGDCTQYGWYVPNPRFDAWYQDGHISAYDWLLGTVLTLEIDDPDVAGNPDYSTTTTVGIAPWDSNQTLGEFNLNGAFDIQPGMTLTVSGASLTKTLVIADLTVTNIDLAADTVAGTAESQQPLWMYLDNSSGNCCRNFQADIDGNWLLDYSQPGSEGQQTEDIAPGSSGTVNAPDDDGDNTSVNWNVPNPHFGVRANDDRVEGWEWPNGTTVTIEIERDGTLEITRTAVVGPAPWNPNEIRFDYNFGGEFDIQVGDVVTVTHEGTAKSTVVTLHSITGINITTDIVYGVSDPDVRVDVWACDDYGCYNRHAITDDVSGEWRVDFSQPGSEPHEQDVINIVPGTWVDSEQRDQDGDKTMFGTDAPTGIGKTAPADGAIDVSLSPTLSWSASDGATSYEYCYSSVAGPCTKWNSVGSDTSITLSGLAPNYTYYWQVRAVNPGSTAEADGGTWWSFTTTAASACTWPPYTAPTTPTFGDVPMDVGHWSWVERLANSTITAGCGAGNYCPFSEVVRAQMAIFLLRGKHCGSSYTPPAVGDSTGFGDVPLSASYAPWVKQLAAEGVTAGCGGGNFCPQTVVNRAQMAIFLLRAKHGSTYSPPAVGATTGFGDVPLDASYAPWVKQLAAEGVTAGCGGGNFCPLQNVNRAQMATFLVRAFGLP